MTTTIEGHSGVFLHYWQLMINHDYQYWIFLVPFGILVGLLQRDKLLKKFTWFLLLSVIQYFFLISIAKTKIDWYESPLFPLLAIIVGIFLSWIFSLIQKRELRIVRWKLPFIASTLTVLIFVKPYLHIIGFVYHYKEPDWAEPYYDIPNYLRHAMNDHVTISGYKVMHDFWPASILFYQKMLEEHGQRILLVHSDELKAGDRVIASQKDFFSIIEKDYDAEVLDYWGRVRVYRIDSVKNLFAVQNSFEAIINPSVPSSNSFHAHQK